MKAGDVIEMKDGEVFEGGFETVRIGSVVVDRIWIEDLQNWFDRAEIEGKCRVVDHEDRPRSIPARRAAISDEMLHRMAAAAFETKNSMTRQGVKKDETITQMVNAMRAEMLRC